VRARTLIPLSIGLLAFKLSLDHFYDVDLFWHLRLGLDILECGVLPRTVEYSWTVPGAPYLPNDWLAQVLFAAAYRVGGFSGVAVFKAALVVATGLTLYEVARERARGNAIAAGLPAALALTVAATAFIARPLLLGFLCLAVELFLVERLRRGARWAVLAMPGVFCVWINAHGTWPIGLGALAAAALDALWESRRARASDGVVPPASAPSLFAGLALAFAGLFANPVGIGFLARPFKLLAVSRGLGEIAEWSAVPLKDPAAWLLAALAALTAWGVLRTRGRRRPFEIALALAALGMAVSAVRHLVLFALIAAPVAAEHLATRWRGDGLANAKLNAAVAAIAALLLGGIGALKLAGVEDEVRRESPSGPVEALRATGLSGERGFHFFDWGGYLVFQKIPSFIDGRLEPFVRAGVFQKYWEIESKADVAGLEAMGVRWILARRGTLLDVAVAQRAGWSCEAQSEQAVLWLRGP
jgi:hypothetical protein